MSPPVRSCPLQSIPVHSCHIPNRSLTDSPKTHVIIGRMKRSQHRDFNLNPNLNRSAPTRRDRIAHFQRASDPIGVNSWNSCLSVAAKPKLTKTDRSWPIMPGAHYTNQSSYSTSGGASSAIPCAPLRLRAFALKSASRKSAQNPYKSDHFRECEFSIPVTSTTYNSNTLKCTDFPIAPRPPSSLGHSSFFRISSLVIRHCRIDLLKGLVFGAGVFQPLPSGRKMLQLWRPRRVLSVWGHGR